MSFRNHPDLNINVRNGKFEDLPFCVASTCACRSEMEDDNSVELDVLPESDTKRKCNYNFL